MVKTEDIYLNFSGDDNTERIFSLIKDIYDYDTAYHTYDGRIAFVNLMGDTFYGTDSLDDCVPSYPYQNCSRDGGEDIYYAKLTGAAPNYDQYPDLMLGRCSVDTITQIENIVNKITNYAPSSSPNNDLILTFLGEDNSNPFPPAKLKSFENLISNYKDDFKLWLLPDEDQYSSHTCWDTIIPYNRDTLFSIYDGGCLMMNYLGHGSKNAMWPKLSGSLCYSQFINKTPALIPMLTNACCLTGSFQQVDDCLGEEFLLENDSTGAISFIGSKKSSHYSIWKMLMPGIYKPFLEQRIFTAGEIFLSAQLTADIVRSDDNLLGDPAMNLQYENIDTILPDIRIEKYAFNIPDWGMSNDTVVYEILLKNQTYKNIDSVFYCNISYRSFNAGEYISVDSVLVSGIDGYATDTITLQWITTNIENGTYNISIGCDTENKITEQDEDNNNIELDIVIVDVTNHFSIKNNNILNSTPISFNMSCLNENEEIHIGPNIYSIEGTSISTFDKLTRSDVAIGWHTDSLKFIKALIVNGTQKENAFFCVQGANYWSYEFNSKFTDPVFFDINYDGSDEILLLSSDFDSGGVNTQMELRVFDGDGNLDYQTTNFKHIPNINDPPTVREVYNMCVFPGEDIKSAFLPSINEMIYEVRIVNGNILVNDSISRTFDINTPITGYIDENGDRVLVLTDVYNKINDYTKVVQYNFDTKTVIDSCIISKIIDVEYDKNFVFLDDLNNDGMQEMILAKENVGFYIISLSNEISDSIYCKVLPNARPVTLDVNGDNHKDILFLESDTLGFTRFSAIDYSMERIWSIPVMDGIVGSWVSDIDDNGHAELI
nr:hypothetical protein [Bacteroidota bacterium]